MCRLVKDVYQDTEDDWSEDEYTTVREPTCPIYLCANDHRDPAVKRTLCKECNLILVPGATAVVRVNREINQDLRMRICIHVDIIASSSHGHAVCYTCISCQTMQRIPAPPILDINASTDTAELTRPSNQPKEETSSAMDVNLLREEGIKFASSSRHVRRKSGPRPRLPPLFERNVGHVVFRGNERIA